MVRNPLLILIATLSIGERTLQAQEQSTPSEFKQKIIDTWSELFPRIKSGSVMEERESYRAYRGKPLRLVDKGSGRHDFSATGLLGTWDNKTFDEAMKVTESYSTFEIFNEKYHAQISKAPAGNGWVLRDLKMGREPPGDAPFMSKDRALFWTLVGNVLLYRWMQDPSFQFIRIEPTPEQHQPHIVRAHFVCDASKRSGKDLPGHIPSGYIDFDAIHSYRPTSYQYQLRTRFSTGFERGSFEYADGKDFLTLKQKTEESETNGEKFGLIKSKSVYTYAITYNSDVPDEQFRLSYYGLPEPVGVEWPKRTSRWRWIVGAALAALMLAVLFRYLHRRAVAASSAKRGHSATLRQL